MLILTHVDDGEEGKSFSIGMLLYDDYIDSTKSFDDVLVTT
jgi:hypothetical protein